MSRCTSSSAVLLGQGDLVSIVGDTPEGLIRSEAIVLGETAPDWYLGRLPDGSEVEFRIDQVEEVHEASPSMGGIFDWFKKKPAPPTESKSLLPSRPEEGGIFYVGPTGVAKYEPPKRKKKGFAAPIKEAVKSFFTSAPEWGKSIFDIFKTPTALIPDPERDPIKFEKVSSIFSQFIPPEGAIEPLLKKAQAFIPPEGPTPLAPYIEKAQEIFEHVQPSAPPTPYEETQAKQMEIWEEMFDPSKEEESLAKGFDIFQPSEKARGAFEKAEVVKSRDLLIPEDYYQDRPGEKMEIKALPMPPRRTLLPSVEDVARGLIGFFNDQRKKETFPDSLFNTFAEVSREWREQGAPGVILKTVVETIGLHDGTPDPLEGIAILLQIPWEEFRKRAVIEDAGDGEEEWTDVSQIREEIVDPGLELVDEAFRLIKPEHVPGNFVVGYSEDCGCLELYYIDQARELTQEEGDYLSYYGHLPSGEMEEDPLQEESSGEEPAAPKKRPAKKKAKKKKAKR